MDCVVISRTYTTPDRLGSNIKIFPDCGDAPSAYFLKVLLILGLPQHNLPVDRATSKVLIHLFYMFLYLDAPNIIFLYIIVVYNI